MGVEQVAAVKVRLPEVALVCEHCVEVTHCEVALATRREPEREMRVKFIHYYQTQSYLDVI